MHFFLTEAHGVLSEVRTLYRLQDMQCQLYNQIYEDFGVPFFVDHASALTKRFDSKSSMLWGIPSFDNLAERIVPSTVLLRTFRLPLLRFFRDFSSVVSRMPGYNAKTGHGPHSPSGTAASLQCLPTVAYLRLSLCHSGFEPQKASQPKYAWVLSMPSRFRESQWETVRVSAVCDWVQRCGETQEWLSRP